MILGMPASTFTLVHVLLSLVGIGTGVVVLAGLLARKRLDGWTAWFLATTVATSATGFGFPSDHLLPSHVFGVISLVVLGLAIFARYSRRLARPWNRVYVVCAVIALYLNSFVGVVQAFLKVPALKALAPTQGEPPFALAQGVLLLLFVVAGAFATMRFRAEAVGAGGR